MCERAGTVQHAVCVCGLCPWLDAMALSGHLLKCLLQSRNHCFLF